MLKGLAGKAKGFVENTKGLTGFGAAETNMLTGILPQSDAASSAKIGPEASKDICAEFKKILQENNVLYQEEMRKSIEGYLTNTDLLKELNNIFSTAVLKYIETTGFAELIDAAAKDAMIKFLTDKFKAGLENEDEETHKKYEEICKEAKKKDEATIPKHEDVNNGANGGRRTKSTRKPRKRTIKRRR